MGKVTGAVAVARPSQPGRRRRGRPSVVCERRSQIVSAFIDLIGSSGLRQFTLDDVAAAAGVSRSALNHFIGNRDDLIVATVEELAARYTSVMRELGGTEPDIVRLIDVIFSADWVWSNAAEDVAFDALMGEARHDPRTRDTVKVSYEVFVGEVTAALRRSYPDAPLVAVRDTAYAIVCLAEENIGLQQLGFSRNRVRGAKNAALMVAASLGAT